jgi:hypothetical protein
MTSANEDLKHLIHAIQSQKKPNMKKQFGTLLRNEIEQVDKLLKSDEWGNRIKKLREQKEASRQQALEQHFKAKGQSVPEHLKNPQPEVLDYKKMKPHSPAPAVAPAAKQPSQKAPPPTPQKGPVQTLFDPDLSGKIDYKRKKLIASEPSMDTSKHCAALKKMVGCMKKVDPTTHLPGVLMSKNKKDKTNA